MALVGKHLHVVPDSGGNDAKNATSYEENGEPEEPRLVERKKHGYRLSGADATANVIENANSHPKRWLSEQIDGDPIRREECREGKVAYAIFLPRVRGTTIGSCVEQNFPLL